MADTPTQFQPGDQVAVLEGSAPMTVKSVSADGRTVTCVNSNEDEPEEQQFDATKLTKLHSGEESGVNS
ncbi:hypothetical protein [Spirosoma sp. KNUC1025]|uniref:hypothetical protein n=1 Tax=Spirosoma sp. KNUC1025 TaxID=2894082 RepID=UPI00386EB6AE|nr:hypothetical protein LN737_17515 [Spirosoma sp. KNUC1025]